MSDQAMLVQEALRLLGVQHLVLAIHDVSFPAMPEEDIGWGSPYSEGGRGFLAFLRSLGFTGVQLGPQGELSLGNPSPYDASMFSRSPLSIALSPLTTKEWGCLLTRQELEEAVSRRPSSPGDRAHYHYAEGAMRKALSAVHERFQGGVTLTREFSSFCQESEPWLTRDTLYSLLHKKNGGRAFEDWDNELDQRLWWPAPGEEALCEARRRQLLREHAKESEAYQLGQLIVHRQHQELRSYTRSLGLQIYGDLQIGMSLCDAWGLQGLLLREYQMGAPPSRTNPDGQPWGYPALDPALYHRGGLALMRGRLRKIFSEFDGVRIDHPHGLIDPWVYRAGAVDPLKAVQGGGRLFSSPGLADHPALARHAIARPEQLNLRAARYADDWVTALSEDQVERYATLFEVVVSCAREANCPPQSLICEVLSTMPYPVGAVLARYGLGRFRVTQKANTQNTNDVYRAENASPQDWIMVGTHDTPPLWRLLERWPDDTRKEQASYLAWRLSPRPERLAQQLSRDASLLAHAKFADLFLGPAKNVSVFFSDLFGLKEIYNTPGTISEQNWSLRLSHDYQEVYEARRHHGEALDLRVALSMALRGRSATEGSLALAERLALLPHLAL